MKPATSLTIVLLLVVATAHLVRIAAAIPVMVGATSVPVWVSAVGVVLPLGLALGMWRETRQ